MNDSFALPKAFLFWMFIPLFFMTDDFSADKEEMPVYFVTVIYFLLSLFSIYPMLSFTGLYRYYFNGFFSLFAGVALFRILRKFPESVIKKLLGFLLFSALLTCAAVFAGGGTRISSTFGNPNFYGGVLAALIPYALFFSLSKAGYGIHFIFFAIALLMTLSRASWVGASAGILFFVLSGKGRGASKAGRARAARNILAATALILAGAFIISTHFAGDIFRRAVSIFNLSEADIVSRFEGYAASMAIFAEKPFFGHGPESFSILFRSHAPVSFIKQIGGLAHAGYSHCYPMQLLAETGLAGFGVWLFLIFVLLKKAFTSKELFKKAAGASVTAYVVTNLFAFPSITELLVFWFSAAVIYGPERGGGCSTLRPSRFPVLASRAAAFVFILFPIATLISEISFVSAGKNPDPVKAYAKLRRADFFLPSDYHLMNAGKICIVFYEKTGAAVWLDRGDEFFQKLIKRNPRHALALNGAGVAARENFI
ncbi:O-antigen ligase family protein, partial [bacterium]|nr:O-antigen ligase family protein [bacterium]